MILPVLVEGWQLECCGTPFSLGDEVRWTLTARPPGSGTPREAVVDVGRAGRESDGAPWVRRDGVSALWTSPSEPPDAPIAAVLVEEHHGAAADVHAVRATVRRIRVVARHLALRGGSWSPDSQPPRLRDVERSAAGFAGARPQGNEGWTEHALLVDLEVHA